MTQFDATDGGLPSGEPVGSADSFDIDALIASSAAAAEAEAAELGTAEPALEPQRRTAPTAASGGPAGAPEPAQEPDATEQLLANDPAFATLSRAQRGKVIEAMQAKLETAEASRLEAQTQADELRLRADAQQQHLQDLAGRYEQFFGSQERYEELERAVHDINDPNHWDAVSEINAINERRQMLPLADAIALGKIGVTLEDAAKAHGLKVEDVRAKADFASAFGLVVDAIKQAHAAEIKELKAQHDADRAALEGHTVRRVSAQPSAEVGGRSSAGGPLGQYLDPSTGLPSEEVIQSWLDGAGRGLDMTG